MRHWTGKLLHVMVEDSVMQYEPLAVREGGGTLSRPGRRQLRTCVSKGVIGFRKVSLRFERGLWVSKGAIGFRKVSLGFKRCLWVSNGAPGFRTVSWGLVLAFQKVPLGFGSQGRWHSLQARWTLTPHLRFALGFIMLYELKIQGTLGVSPSHTFERCSWVLGRQAIPRGLTSRVLDKSKPRSRGLPFDPKRV